MSLTRLLHCEFSTSRLPIRLDVYRESNPTGPGAWGQAAIDAATGASVEVEAAPGSKLRWERGGQSYGLTIYASLLEVQLRDAVVGGGPGIIRETFRGAFRETDFLVVLSAPPYVTEAGTPMPAFVWYGMPMLSETVPTIAPAVYPGSATTLRLYDGLGALARRRAEPSTGALFAHAVCEPVLRINRHLPLYCGFDAFPPEIVNVGGAAYTRRDPRNLRFAGELAGSGTNSNASRGDFGTERDQVERAAEGMGLVLYQHTTPDPTGPDAGGPSFRLVPRASLGGQLLDVFHASGYSFSFDDGPGGTGRILSDYAVADTNVLADQVTLAAEDFDLGTAPEVIAASAVKLTEAGDANLVRRRPPVLVGAVGYSELLLSIAPVPGIFLRFVARTLPFFGGRLRLRLEGVSGQTYSFGLNGWFEGLGIVFDVDDEEQTRTGLQPPPEAGDLWLDLLNGDDGDDAIFTRFEVGLVDEAGAYVLDWVVNVSRDPAALQEGETVTLRRPPAIEVLPDGDGWVPASGWESRIHRDAENAPRGFTTLGSYLAHDRLAQQGRPLASPDVSVAGLHGPGRLLRFPAANVRPGSVFESNVPCVVGGGLALDLDTGRTQGGFTELTTGANVASGLDAEVPQ